MGSPTHLSDCRTMAPLSDDAASSGRRSQIDGRHRALFPWLLCSLMAVSACALTTVRNRTEIQDALPIQFAGCGPAGAGKPIFWIESFPSEFLQSDVRTLIQENLALKAARARVTQAAAEYGIAGSGGLPALNARGDIDHSRVKEDEPDGTDTTRNTIAFEAALAWEPDIWGRLKTRRAAAALTLREKQAMVDRIALDLQMLLVESWVAHHGARKLKRLLRKQRETNMQLLELAELRFAQGQGGALDVLRQQGLLAATEQRLPGAEAEQRRAANAYAVLTGHLPKGVDLPADRWPVLTPTMSIATPRRLLAERPDLQAAFLALQAADHEVAAAVADRLPRLAIGLTVIESGSGLSQIGDGCVYRIASGLLAPLFDAGHLKAKVARRKAAAREFLAVLEQAMQAAVREVEDAVAMEVALFDRQRLLRKRIAIAADTVEKAARRYANGLEAFPAVLSALAEQQALQQNDIALQQELLINRGRLLKALGAKWGQLP